MEQFRHPHQTACLYSIKELCSYLWAWSSAASMLPSYSFVPKTFMFRHSAYSFWSKFISPSLKAMVPTNEQVETAQGRKQLALRHKENGLQQQYSYESALQKTIFAAGLRDKSIWPEQSKHDQVAWPSFDIEPHSYANVQIRANRASIIFYGMRCARFVQQSCHRST